MTTLDQVAEVILRVSSVLKYFDVQLAVLGLALQFISAFTISHVYEVTWKEAIDIGAGTLVTREYPIYGPRTDSVRAALTREVITALSVHFLFFGLAIQMTGIFWKRNTVSPIAPTYILLLLVIFLSVFLVTRKSIVKRIVSRRIKNDVVFMFSRFADWIVEERREAIGNELSELLEQDVHPDDLNELMRRIDLRRQRLAKDKRR